MVNFLTDICWLLTIHDLPSKLFLVSLDDKHLTIFLYRDLWEKIRMSLPIHVKVHRSMRFNFYHLAFTREGTSEGSISLSSEFVDLNDITLEFSADMLLLPAVHGGRERSRCVQRSETKARREQSGKTETLGEVIPQGRKVPRPNPVSTLPHPEYVFLCVC